LQNSFGLLPNSPASLFETPLIKTYKGKSWYGRYAPLLQLDVKVAIGLELGWSNPARQGMTESLDYKDLMGEGEAFKGMMD
jgi:hypothetical protein